MQFEEKLKRRIVLGPKVRNFIDQKMKQEDIDGIWQ